MPRLFGTLGFPCKHYSSRMDHGFHAFRRVTQSTASSWFHSPNSPRQTFRSSLLKGVHVARQFSSQTPSIKIPGPATTTWERSAVRVKNTDINNPYLEAIRDTHDPTLHLKTIEDELKSTIGKALGKQGDKILQAVCQMKEEFQVYEKYLEEHETIDHPEVQASAMRYNEIRKRAITARWELMVHRQAAGFIVNNHKYVMEHYPISEALPLSSSEEANKPIENKKKPAKKFGDQLDWWQRIGRWR